jgi:hypothetical protein
MKGYFARCSGCGREENYANASEVVMHGWSVSRQVNICSDCRNITLAVCDAKLPSLEPEDSPYPDIHAPVGNGIWCYRRRPNIEEVEG